MSETLFKEVRYTFSDLANGIGIRQVSLLDIAHPFVWSNVKMRYLFDLLYRGSQRLAGEGA